jgi:hypothetical protein
MVYRGRFPKCGLDSSRKISILLKMLQKVNEKRKLALSLLAIVVAMTRRQRRALFGLLQPRGAPR